MLNDEFVGLESTAQTNEADRHLVVRFSTQPRLDSEATAREGREVYKEIEFVTILIPGDKTLTVHRPIMKSDLQRFPMQYQAFKNTKGEVLTGTPIAGWPLATEAQRKELEYFNVRTVEALSMINDNFAGSMMGIQQLKQAAIRYLQAAKERAPAVKFAKELESRDAEISALKDQMAKLMSKFEEKAPTKSPTK